MSELYLPADSDVWVAARRLAKRQATLRKGMSRHLSSLPRTGLFEDEYAASSSSSSTGSGGGGSSGDNDFASRVRQVRSSLALSPKTVLLRVADDELAKIYINGGSIERERLTELLSLLAIDDDGSDNNAEEGGVGELRPFPVSIRTISAALAKMNKGRVYARWERVTSDIGGDGGRTLPPWESDPQSFRAKVADGMKLKSAGRRPPSDREVAEAISRAIERGDERRRKLEQKAAMLRKSLESDLEYLRWRRAHELWEMTGAKDVWEKFLAADRREGRARRESGEEFEERMSQLCFAEIALEMCKDDACLAAGYSYVRGAYWRDATSNARRKQKHFGEVDLVVLNDASEVVAICEMKRDCIEIASAFAQHESKLEMALSGQGVELTTSSDGDGPALKFCHTENGAINKKSVRLYVATILPSKSAASTLGVVPALAHAICEGIRKQGLKVRGSTTASAARSLDSAWALESGFINRSDAKRAPIADGPKSCSNNAAGRGATEVCDPLDMDVLERYVRERLGPRRLAESPLSCFERCRDCVLVVESGENL